MSAVGYPDDEERTLPFGSVLSTDAGLAVPASPATTGLGPFAVTSYQAVLLQYVVVTNPVTAVFTWSLDGALGAAATSAKTVTLPVGTSRLTVLNQGHVLDSVSFSGSGGAATLRYALVGANPNPLAVSGFDSPQVIPILAGEANSYDGFGWTSVTVDAAVRNNAKRTNQAAFHVAAVNDRLTHYVTLGPQGSFWGLLMTYKAIATGGKAEFALASVTDTDGVLSDTAPGAYVTHASWVVDTYAAVAADATLNGYAVRLILDGASGDTLTTLTSIAGDLHGDGGPGVYSLRAKVTGKNVASAGFEVAITGLAFVRLNEIAFLGGF
mgnify:CR=1 FL=1